MPTFRALLFIIKNADLVGCFGLKMKGINFFTLYVKRFRAFYVAGVFVLFYSFVSFFYCKQINNKQMNEISNKDQLREMVSKLKDDYVDNTEYLREAKNSVRIRNDLLAMERLKRSYGGDIKSDEFAELCKVECSFLYNNYMHIFNKLLKDVLDLKMMFEFLQILQSIEEGQVNQEEASVIIGKKLKEMYIDSAIREGEQLDEINRKPLPEEGKCISWKQYAARQKK